MARKKVGTLEEQRTQIKKRYKHGPRARRDLVNFEKLSEVEKAVKMEAACFLKAADFSFTYIAEALGTTRGTVSGWFEDNQQMRVRVGEIQADYIDGAVTLLKSYAVELVEMLVNIAREAEDPKVRIQAITEALDRMGLSKVNKSESAATVTRKDELDIIDKTGLMRQMQDAPPEVQQAVASKLEEAFAMASEHTDRSVTHA